MKSSLETLFALPLVSGLLNRSVTTIWAEQRYDGKRIKVRNVPKGPVVIDPSTDFDQFVTAVSQVLDGRYSLDVTVNQVDIMITHLPVVGGVDWVMTTANTSHPGTFQAALSVTI